MSSTKSKHYTESDTAIRKSSGWFRISSSDDEYAQLFDLYWGGKERRITGLTLRIIGVNIIALVSLIFGIVYLGQYHSTLIESQLKRFETELLLVTSAITEGVLETKGLGEESVTSISVQEAQGLSALLGATIKKRILIFDQNDLMIADSKAIIEENSIQPLLSVEEDEEFKLNSVEILKDTASWVASLFPKHSKLPLFTGVESQDASSYSDVIDAKRKHLSISAWQNLQGKVVLTGALPVVHDTEIHGTVLLVADDENINKSLADAWFNILKIFWVTLLITILISIYLSGVIARPLRKLANAAENVRKGKLKHTEIPDMSDRHDEIGELSLVLRDMTAALWERMDTIEAFAADVSHEIKNPLTSLKSAVETAAIVTKKADREKLFQVIKHDIDRLDRLITDISSASRLDVELSREAFEKVDLKGTLRQLLDAYKSPLERESHQHDNSDQVLKDGILITLDLPDYTDIYVLGSESRLMQVFQNIISNALSFSPTKSKIKILASVKANRVTISIEDSGPGIPEARLKNVFERFYSERPQHEEFGRHSGLGLSICKQIISAHNGVIFAENKTDRSGEVSGARFVIVLNLIKEKDI